MMAINQYFDKYKASALGLGYSGDCFGTFTFPVLMEYLISHYGVKGTFLIAGGMVLNVIPMALLLRKPSWINNTKKSTSVKRSSKSKKNDHHTLKTHTNSILLQRNRMLKIHSHSGCLSTVNENEGQADDFQNNESAEDGRHLVTFGIDLKGQYNKGFESSETSLNLVGNRNETKHSLVVKKEDKLESLKTTAISPQMHRLNPASNNSSHRLDVCSTSSVANDSKSFLMPEDFRVSKQITSSRSVTDLNRRNGSFCHGSPRLGLPRYLLEEQRRDSLPLVFSKEKFIKDKNEKLQSLENMKNENLESDETVKNDIPHDNEVPLAAVTGITKKRTSSFVGQVAQDIVNRMRTASFASQMAQDGFVATIGQESESESECEAETECQLKSIVEHKDHDAENCTYNDLILSIDKNMVDDYLKDSPEKPEKEIEEKKQAPSILKLLLRTNSKPMFVLISMSLAVYVFMFVSILTIIIDYAEDLGVEEERGKFLLIGFSVADLFGRLSFGQVIDRNMMKMKNYAGATFSLMGALVAVVPLNTSFNYMMVCMCMYGVVQGGSAIMFPILINQYMEKNLESVAMGSLNFYGGILMLLMAPMIGKNAYFSYFIYVLINCSRVYKKNMCGKSQIPNHN